MVMICLQDQQRLLSNEVLVVKYFLGCFELRFVSCGIWLILCSYLKFHSCLESRLVKVNPNLCLQVFELNVITSLMILWTY